jgi:pimeloyl-[acyl-carrier protein] methyl ester esterase
MRTLVLLHGWGASGAIWRRQEAAFAPAFRVLAPDIPAWEAGWLAGFLKDLPLKDTVLVGWSLGGMVLLEALPRLLERPAALVLVGVAAAFCQRPDHPFGPETGLLRAMRRSLATNPGRILADFARLCLAPGEVAFREEAVAAFAAVTRVANLAQGLDYLQTKDLRALLPTLSGPVAIIQGEKDAIVPPAQGRFLARRIPGARLFLMPAAGHLPFLTQAPAFNQILRGLLPEQEF